MVAGYYHHGYNHSMLGCILDLHFTNIMKKLYTFYRIFDRSENYIGMTCQTISNRITRHRYRAYTEMQQSKLYKHVRASSSLMYQVINQEVLTESDARLKEMMYIKFSKPSLNTAYGN